MAKEFDVIIFGATGYTGHYVIEELAKSNKNGKKKWAVAGRNEEKLKAALETVQQYLDDDIDIMNIPIVKADVKDETSIDEMCKKAKLIINCVGPYKLYGEVVVAACVKNGTHHVDISGEIQYLEGTQAKYFKEAREKGVYIVQACGFDSVPSDLGVALLKQKFEGDLNSVESYVQFFGGPEGRTLNSGTWISAVHSVKDVLSVAKYNTLLKSIFDKEMPSREYPLRSRFPLFYSNIVNGWCVWFMGPDERVVKRSQRFSYQFLNERPVQFRAYMDMQSLYIALISMFFVIWFGLFSLFSAGMYLLEKFPSFFSAGMFTHEGPTRKQVEESSTKLVLCGEGWAEKTAEPSDRHVKPPNKKMKLEIAGPEPAYALTSICLVQSGLVILEESDKIPLSGGVLTPGVAFAKTNLQKRLEERGVSFIFDG